MHQAMSCINDIKPREEEHEPGEGEGVVSGIAAEKPI
jgi:hypothetical protein